MVCPVSTVIDLARRRKTPATIPRLEHPAGVLLPCDGTLLPGIIEPDLRVSISQGTYAADMIALLPDLLRDGDRVLVIGDGFGLISTLIAKSEILADVIVVEADLALLPYLQSVHVLNGTSWVQTVNAFPGIAIRGRVPFFARRDPRRSSLSPADGPWLRISMAPLIDLDLLLEEAQISVIVWGCAASAARVLAEADLRAVQRIALHGGGETDLPSLLERKGFASTNSGETILLRRSK